MKERGIARDIGKGRSKGSDGGPGLGHVNRMAVGGGHSGQHGERRRRRVSGKGEKAAEDPHHQQQHHTLLVRWTMLFGALALVILALVVMFWLMPHLEQRKEIGQRQTKVLTAIKEPAENVPGEREAVSLAKKAMEVTEAEDVQKCIQSDSESPEEVLAFLRKVRHEDGEISRYDWLMRLDTFREDISGVVVTFVKDGESRNRLVLLTPDEDGRWKMDFAAFARTSTPDWGELMGGVASSAIVRVYVAPDHYFNGPFSEQENWRCFGIASPDMPELFYGYCLAGSPQEKVLTRLLSDRKSARATIGIERVEGSSNRQFRIKRVLAEDWVIGETPADDPAK